MSALQSLGSFFLGALLYSFPWIVYAAEPVAPSPKVESVVVKDVAFTGNTFVGPDLLKAKLTNTDINYYRFDGPALLKAKLTTVKPECGVGTPIFTYDLANADADVAKLADYYREFGFLNVRVAREVVFDKEFQATRVIFRITEGPRYHLLDCPPVVNSRED